MYPYHQSHLGEKLNSFKGRPERCFTCQLETTNIYLQPDKHNQIKPKSKNWLLRAHSNRYEGVSLCALCHYAPQTAAAWSSPHVSGTCGPCLCLCELPRSGLGDQQQKSTKIKNKTPLNEGKPKKTN